MRLTLFKSVSLRKDAHDKVAKIAQKMSVAQPQRKRGVSVPEAIEILADNYLEAERLHNNEETTN